MPYLFDTSILINLVFAVESTIYLDDDTRVEEFLKTQRCILASNRTIPVAKMAALGEP